MLCFVLLCYVMWWHDMLYHVYGACQLMSAYVRSCHVMCCDIFVSVMVSLSVFREYGCMFVYMIYVCNTHIIGFPLKKKKRIPHHPHLPLSPNHNKMIISVNRWNNERYHHVKKHPLHPQLQHHHYLIQVSQSCHVVHLKNRWHTHGPVTFVIFCWCRSPDYRPLLII